MNGTFERGEVYWVNLGSGFKNEKGVFRPGVVVARESFTRNEDCVMVALTTTKNKGRDYEVRIDVTNRPSYVMCNEVNTYDKERFGDYIGQCTPEEMRAIEDALELVFDLGYKDDDELEQLRAEIGSKDAIITGLQEQLAAYAGINTDEITALRVENAVIQKLYGKAVDELASIRFAKDLAARQPAEDTLVAPEVPQHDEIPHDLRLDINHCTGHQLKKLGFAPEIADRIIRARPFGCLEDLKKVFGLTTNMYRLKSPMLFCTPFAPKVLDMTEPDAVNINQCAAKDLINLGMNKNTAYKITSHRNRNGLFSSVSDLKSVRGVSAKQYAEFASRLAV